MRFVYIYLGKMCGESSLISWMVVGCCQVAWEGAIRQKWPRIMFLPIEKACKNVRFSSFFAPFLAAKMLKSGLQILNYLFINRL